VVRSWRIVEAEPSGCMMWFDPDVEVPHLTPVPPLPRSSEGLGPLLAGSETISEVDSRVSVRGPTPTPTPAPSNETPIVTPDDDLPF